MSHCGRPLGMRFNNNGSLILTDAYKGLYSINTITGEKSYSLSHRSLETSAVAFWIILLCYQMTVSILPASAPRLFSVQCFLQIFPLNNIFGNHLKIMTLENCFTIIPLLSILLWLKGSSVSALMALQKAPMKRFYWLLIPAELG